MNLTTIEDKKFKLEWLQALRGLAATMVVFCHVGMWEGKAFGARIVTPGFLQAGEAGVDIFFVISGFIMLFITPVKFRGVLGWLAFLYRRFTRIFPPYWMVCIGLWLVWLRKPDLFNNYAHNQVDIVRSFLLLPQLFTPLLSVGWSLIHEIYFYCVVSLIFCLGHSSRIYCFSAWFLGLLAINWTGGTAGLHGHPALQLLTSPFSMEFQFGIVLALSWKPLARLRLGSAFYVMVASISFVSLYVIGCCLPSLGVYPDNNHLFRTLSYGIPALLLVGAMVQLDVSALFKAPRWATLAGDASYAIYLLHLPILNALFKVTAKVFHHPTFALCCVNLLLIAALSILLPAMFYLFFERRLISYFHRISPFKTSEGINGGR